MIHQLPDLTVGIVIDQFLVARRTHLAGPDDARSINVGTIVHPFLVDIVAFAIVDEYQLLPGACVSLCRTPSRRAIKARLSYRNLCSGFSKSIVNSVE